MVPFMDQFLSKYQCDLRKGFNAQHCLLVLLEKWKKVANTKNIFNTVLTDLSKAFDCLLYMTLLLLSSMLMDLVFLH